MAGALGKGRRGKGWGSGKSSRINAAQISAAHAAGDAVVPGGVREADEGGAGAGHGGVLGQGAKEKETRAAKAV